MIRLQVVLDPEEADLLARWASSELRDPRDQIRFVLRQALQERGPLLTTDTDDQCDKTQTRAVQRDA